MKGKEIAKLFFFLMYIEKKATYALVHTFISYIHKLYQLIFLVSIAHTVQEIFGFIHGIKIPFLN
jgi:hypothetical protein